VRARISILLFFAFVGIFKSPSASCETFHTYRVEVPLRSGAIPAIIKFDHYSKSKIHFHKFVKIILAKPRSRRNGGEINFSWRRLDSSFVWEWANSQSKSRLIPPISDSYVTYAGDIIRNSFSKIRILPVNQYLTSIDGRALKDRLTSRHHPKEGALLSFECNELTLKGPCRTLRFQPCVTSKYSKREGEESGKVMRQIMRVSYGLMEPMQEPSHLPILFLPLGGILLIIGLGLLATATRSLLRGVGVALTLWAIASVAMPYWLM
jgi:hypothetical protein